LQIHARSFLKLKLKIENSTMPSSRKDTIDIKALTQAFELLTETAERLGRSNEALNARVSELSQELARKNDALEQKIAEVEALKNELSTVLESLTDGVVAIDTHGRIRSINPAAAFTLGINEVEAVGHAAKGALGEGAAALWELIDATRKDGQERMNVEASVVGLTGDRTLSVSISPLVGDVGRGSGVVASFRDLTDIKRMEAEMRRKDRLAAVGEMAAAVSHEIRNPLGGIQLYASLLERSLADRPKDAEIVAKIQAGISNLNRTVEDMLDFTRELVPDMRPVDLGAVLDAAAAGAGAEIAAKRAVVERRYSKDRNLRGDAHLLGRIFINLIRNAAQVSPPGGRLTLSVDREGSAVVARVSDEGPGITPEARQKMFTPFYTSKADGTGLGLAIAQRIVEAHKGAITARNNEPGAGATFEVWLPGNS
jgi:PAS domain S-box-containing protein